MIYYLKRSGMFRKTERRLKTDMIKVFICTSCWSAFFWSFQSKRGFSQSVKTQLMSQFSVYIQLTNIILLYSSAFGKFYLYLDIYISYSYHYQNHCEYTTVPFKRLRLVWFFNLFERNVTMTEKKVQYSEILLQFTITIFHVNMFKYNLFLWIQHH